MSDPAVSIMIPLYDGAATVVETLQSVLTQSFENIEVVVLDDASSDEGPDVVEALDDPRLKLLRFEHAGLARNFNRCIAHARAPLMKILPQDDVLHSDHVGELVSVMRECARPALAFCPRDVLHDANDPWAAEWAKLHDQLELCLEPLKPVNDGPTLLRLWSVAGRLNRNCIGEPVATLFCTRLAREVGGFSPIMKQDLDFALWIRLMARGDVAYSPRRLCTFRMHAENASHRHISEGHLFYEFLMLYEELASDERVLTVLPELRSIRRRELRRNFSRRLARRLRFWEDKPSVPSRPPHPPSGSTRLHDPKHSDAAL